MDLRFQTEGELTLVRLVLHKRQTIIQHDVHQTIQRFLFLGFDQLFVHLHKSRSVVSAMAIPL